MSNSLLPDAIALSTSAELYEPPLICSCFPFPTDRRKAAVLDGTPMFVREHALRVRSAVLERVTREWVSVKVDGVKLDGWVKDRDVRDTVPASTAKMGQFCEMTWKVMEENVMITGVLEVI